MSTRNLVSLEQGLTADYIVRLQSVWTGQDCSVFVIVIIGSLFSSVCRKKFFNNQVRKHSLFSQYQQNILWETKTD